MGGAIIVNCPELDNCCLLTLEYSFNLIPYLTNLSPNNIFLTFDFEPSRMKVLFYLLCCRKAPAVPDGVSGEMNCDQ